MKKIIALGAAAMLAVAAGCSKNKGTGSNSAALGPQPTPPAGAYTPIGSGATNTGRIDELPPAGTSARDITEVGPAAGGPAAPAKGTKYTVQRGDTLWSIATKVYGDGKQYKKIATANHIQGDTIKVGQTLVLP